MPGTFAAGIKTTCGIARTLLMTHAALIGSLTAAISLAVTGLVRGYALRRRFLDHPNERSSHSVPTPRGGGLAILVSATVGAAAALGLGIVPRVVTLTLIAGMIALGLVGWFDDARGVRPGIRFVIQLVVSAATVTALGGFRTLYLGSHEMPVGFSGGVIATMGIVWAINLFNFMDGIDGIAGSQAVLIFGFGAVLLFARAASGLGLLALIFAAASLGFLAWNWPPAKIFMGDVGSGPLGYLIAGLALASDRERSVSLLVFSMLGGVFIFDATVTLLRRLIRGKRPYEAHRDHAYQRMSRAWGRHLTVTIAAAGITVVLSALAAVAVFNPRLLAPSGIAAFILLGALMIAAERRAPM